MRAGRTSLHCGLESPASNLLGRPQHSLLMRANKLETVDIPDHWLVWPHHESVCNTIPLLFIGIENDGLVGVVVVSLQLIAEDSLTCIALKRPTHLLNGICDCHVL